jgi:DNA polymerase III subunit alpha
MLLSQKLAGFSKGDADVLRKAMGKKDRKTLDKMKSKFIDGATAKNLPADKLEKIWTDWEAFAQYAFNKSHSTCYAFVAYQTAYLKAHYPSEYMAAVLNNAGSIEKITFFMEECKRMGLKVLGPDINESLKGFAVNTKGEIRFGLGGLKGVGEAAVEYIIEERNKKGPFKNIFDFIKRATQRTVNKKTLESLVYAGGFDCFTEMHRAQYFFMPQGDNTNGLEKIVRFGNNYQSQTQGNTNTLFGDLPSVMEVPIPKIPNCEPWTLTELLDHEKEVTGMFMSGHPLDHFKFEMQHYGIIPLQEFTEIRNTITVQTNNNRLYKMAGLVIDAQHRVTKTGKNFAVLSIEDYSGKTEFMLWSEDYNRYRNYLEKGLNVYITGFFKQRFNKPELEFKIERMILLETIKQQLTKQVTIDVEARHLNNTIVDFLVQNIKSHPGNSALRFNIKEPKEKLAISLVTVENGFEMNDDLANYLYVNPEFDVKVVTT